MNTRKHKRYKLLLDEGLPVKDKFPQLNNHHQLRHIMHDLRMGAAKDKKIYKLAQDDGMLVIVFNTKDFKPLIESEKPSVISISTNLSNKQIDLKLCSILKRIKINEEKGHLISISNEGFSISKIDNKKN